MKIASMFLIGSLFFVHSAMAERLVCQTVIKNVASAKPLIYEIAGNNVLLKNSNSYRMLRQSKSGLILDDPRGRYVSIANFNLQGRVLADGASITGNSLPFPCTALAASSVPGCNNLVDYLEGGGDRAKGVLLNYAITNLAKPTAQSNATLTIKFSSKVNSSSSATIQLKCQVLK